MNSWFENEKFWMVVEPFLFSQARMERTEGEIDQILDLIPIPEKGRILDVGCGTGRHCLELAIRGFQATGIDRTAKYLKEARKRASKKSLTIEFVQSDFRQYKKKNFFDCAISFFSTFGYFDEMEEEKLMLSNIFTSLKRGGALFMELTGKENLASTFKERDWHTDDDGQLILLEERKIDDSWNRINNKWILIKEGRKKVFHWKMRIFSGYEMETILKDVGFKKVELYGSLSGTPYDNHASQLIVIARK